MTHRKYGMWPGWMVEAGWSEEAGGEWYCTISRFDGDHETEWEVASWLKIRRQDLTPAHIKKWLLGMARRWPEVAPPAGFIRHLWGDQGAVGFHPSVRY